LKPQRTTEPDRHQQTPPSQLGFVVRIPEGLTTKRKALNIARSERRRSQHTQAAAAANPQWIVPAKDAPGIDPRQLQSALARLSDQERRLVVARIWSDMSFEGLAGQRHFVVLHCGFTAIGPQPI
jgi:hypothetical protein